MLSSCKLSVVAPWLTSRFDTRIAADGFMGEAQRLGLECQHGKETPHLKQKALEDPHSSNLYVAEIPLDATDEVSSAPCTRMELADADLIGNA